MNIHATKKSATDGLEFHPLANILPLLEGEAFASLVADVKARGVEQSIYLYEGKILDGRNRYRAALEADVPCSQRVYDGDDPVGFVVSMNLERRMLTVAERALAAAKLANLKRGQTVKSATSPGDGSNGLSPIWSAVDIPTAAKMVGTSPMSVKRAKVVLEEGTPEEIAAVQSGEQSLSHVADEIRVRKGQKPHGSAMGKRARAIANGREPDAIIPRGNSAHVRDYLIKLSQVERMCASMLDVRVPVLGDETPNAIKALETARKSLTQLINQLRRD